MKALCVLLLISNITVTTVMIRVLINLQSSFLRDFKGIKSRLDLMDKQAFLDREIIENKLKHIEDKQLSKEDVRQAVSREVREEVTKLAFTPIKVDLRK